jgi:regulator of protease activity HflC (stomatin/prohibitin superfamily)
MKKNLIASAGVLLGIFLVFYLGIWEWMICRVYVEPDEVLVVTAKFGAPNPDPDSNRVVSEGTQGVLREVRAEGRHFYNPVEYNAVVQSRSLEIEPEQIGLVESMSGRTLPAGEFLADEGFKGVARQPLTPGKWRLNPFAFKVIPVPATIIRPGSVGCITALAGRPPAEGQLAEEGQRGIRKKVLQPGIYYLNPREFKVDIVEIGYSQITMEHVSFPSKDGFTIQLDISVVWGLQPKDVPLIINRFGNVEAVIDKIIRPQVESICRIEGSKYGAKDFIEGTTREQFQTTFTDQLVQEAKSRNMDVLIGLVRDIQVPLELREPIQKSKIAAEEQLTKEEQRRTQIVQNELEELKAEVTRGVREVAAETEKMVANVRAEGDKKVAMTAGDREVAVAEIQKKVAEIEAQRQLILGKAEADVIELVQKAEADKFQKNVAALGNPEAYADYIFATRLPDDLRIDLRYAGQGTFWTDLPAGGRALEDAAARKILEAGQKEPAKK